MPLMINEDAYILQLPVDVRVYASSYTDQRHF